MTLLNPNSAKYREKLWDACVDPATGYVFCNRCGGRVQPTEAWHESHIGAAGPGFTDTPLPGGRKSGLTKKLKDGKVEPRLPRYGKHARAMAALWPHGRPE